MIIKLNSRKSRVISDGWKSRRESEDRRRKATWERVKAQVSAKYVEVAE